MPNISLTLPEVDQSITRPVIFSIIQEIQAITKIKPTAKIFYPGDIGSMQTSGTDIDGVNDRSAIFGSNNILFVETEEDYDINTLGSTAITRREQPLIFIDRSINTYIASIYSTSNVTIHFKYRTTSKTEALRWRDDIRIRVSQLRDINIHNITYHYLLPLDLYSVIKEIHNKRESVCGYGQTLEEYVKEHSTTNLTTISDLAGKEVRLAIAETQSRIIGIYDFEGLPEKAEKDNDNGVWTISFSYKFSYEKPMGCNMRYPVIVHNQLLSKEFVTFTNSDHDSYKIKSQYTQSLNSLSRFEVNSIMESTIDPDAIVRLPSFDDYNLPKVIPGSGTVFIALSEVDTNDNRTLFNLKELGNYSIDRDILDFISNGEYKYVTKLYASIISLDLYRGNYLASSDSLVCDSNLNIKAVTNLDLRNQHRVRFALITDLTLLDSNAIERLKKYPKVLVKIISAMNELLRNHPDFVNMGDKSYLTSLEFSPIYRMLTGFEYNRGNSTGSNYYGQGLQVNRWNSKGISGNLFKGIDPRMVENYRNYRINHNTVMSSGIIAELQNR